MNARSVIDAAQAMANSIGATTAAIREAVLESSNYDRQGRLLSATMKGVDTEGRNFDATLRRTATGGLRVTRLAFEDLNKTASDTKNKFSEIGKAVNEVSGMFQRFAGYKALNAMTDGLKEGFNAARKFQVEISLIRTISQDSQLSFGTWAAGVKKVSNETGFGLADTTKAAYDAISNQVAKGQNVFPFLKDAADLARVNLGGTLEQATNLLSSSINTYGTSVLDVREKSALFFAVIDDGRVTMKDMADTYGRVAILAKGLGVAESDLGASIAFLTQKGVTTDDAFTFMRNVFVQLQKPSTELEALFKKLGVSSGEMAIRTYGNIGLFRKLKEEIESGNTEIAKLFPEIRAQQPITAALGDFKTFEGLADKYRNTAELVKNYQKAVDIRAESPADYIDREFNKLKNTFTVDIGQKLITLAKEILQGLSVVTEFFTGDKSLSAGLNLLIISIRDATIAIVAFRTAATLTSAANLGLAAATTTAGAAAARTATQVTAASIAMRANLVGLLAAATAWAVSRHAFSNDLLSGPAPFESLTEGIQKMREEAAKVAAQKINNPFQDFQKNVNKEFSGVLQELSKLSSEANTQLSTIRDSHKKTSDEFKNMFQAYTDGLKGHVNELNKKVTESEEIIKRSKKGALDFKDSLNKMVDEVRLRNLTGDAKLKFIDQRTGALTGRATDYYKSGDKDKIAEADKLIEQAAQSRKDRFEAEQELFKQRQEAYEAQTPGAYKFTETDYKNKALTDSIKLEAELNELYNLRKQLVGEVVKGKEKEIATTKLQIEQEKTNIRNVQDRFKTFEDFSIVNAKGEFKKEYKIPATDRPDIGKFKRDFDEAAKTLRAEVAKSGNYQAYIQVEDVIARIRKEKIMEIEALERSEAAKTAQQRTIFAQKNFEERIGEIKSLQEKSAKAQKSALDEAEAVSASVKAMAEKALDFRTEFNIAGLRVSNLASDPTGEKFAQTKELVLDAKLAVMDYNNVLARTKRELVDIGGQIVPKPDNIIALNDASKRLRKAHAALYRDILPDINRYDQAVIPDAKDQKTFGEVDERLRQMEDERIKNQANLFAGVDQQKVAQAQYQSQTQPELEKMKGLVPASMRDLDQATKQAASGMSDASKAVYDLKLAADALRGSFNSIYEKKPDTPTPLVTPPIPPTSFSQPIERAYGGWIGRPSNVIGPDKHHVVAGDGEFMVNAESASMFPDTLRAINSARRGYVPQILGGNVSHQRIGDITIIVNESKDGQGTSREVWNKLRREMRRGNLNQGN